MIKRLILILLLTIPGAAALADITNVQRSWAQAMYQTPETERAEALEGVVTEVQRLAAGNPDDPATLIWQGIVLSTYAGEKGGLGALSLVKEARQSLETALELDPSALQGSAYTSLGSLYYKVPGWPIAFGSDKKAKKYLQLALSENPNGIDPNFFMGEFLLEQGDTAQARHYLQQALAAPARPDRPIADAGRREEIRVLLEQVANN